MPPQDVHAEQSVLGGMLLSKDAIADCVEGLRGTDFYRPAHELIYDAILDLYGRGEPADAITVSDELVQARRPAAHRRAGLPPPAHPGRPDGRQRRLLRRDRSERAVLRRLVEAGTRIVQLGYQQGDGDVEDIVNAAQAEVYAVADKRGGEDYHALGDVLEETLNEIEVAAGRTDEMIGVPTGFIELDELTHGLHPGQMIVLAARPAVGKSTIGLDIARAAAIKHKHGHGRLLARDEPHRDHHACALGRGADPAAGPAQGHARRRRLEEAGAHHGPDLRVAAVHRRLAQHVADGDPGQVPGG